MITFIKITRRFMYKRLIELAKDSATKINSHEMRIIVEKSRFECATKAKMQKKINLHEIY